MPRHVLDEFWVHPAARSTIAASHRDIVEEVQASVADNRVVIVRYVAPNCSAIALSL